MEILFVCTGNTCRSPMAEGILNYLSFKEDLNFKAKSAGIFARQGGDISPNSIESMKELDMDISHYKSKSIESLELEDMDLILVMGKSHKEFLVNRYPHLQEKVFLLNQYAFGKNQDIQDPFGGDLEDYKSVVDEIYNAILEIIRRTKDENRYR